MKKVEFRFWWKQPTQLPSSHPEHLAGKGAATAFPSAPALKPTQMDTVDGNEEDKKYDNLLTYKITFKTLLF